MTTLLALFGTQGCMWAGIPLCEQQKHVECARYVLTADNGLSAFCRIWLSENSFAYEQSINCAVILHFMNMSWVHKVERYNFKKYAQYTWSVRRLLAQHVRPA